jgi:hypothetical protein
MPGIEAQPFVRHHQPDFACRLPVCPGGYGTSQKASIGTQRKPLDLLCSDLRFDPCSHPCPPGAAIYSGRLRPPRLSSPERPGSAWVTHLGSLGPVNPRAVKREDPVVVTCSTGIPRLPTSRATSSPPASSPTVIISDGNCPLGNSHPYVATAASPYRDPRARSSSQPRPSPGCQSAPVATEHRELPSADAGLRPFDGISRLQFGLCSRPSLPGTAIYSGRLLPPRLSSPKCPSVLSG